MTKQPPCAERSDGSASPGSPGVSVSAEGVMRDLPWLRFIPGNISRRFSASDAKGAKQAVTNAFKPPLCLYTVISLGSFCLHVASTYGHAAKLSLLLLTANAPYVQGSSSIPSPI